MKIWSAMAMMVLATGVAELASATTGGPLTVEVLGWDPTSQRVYLRQTAQDDSHDRDCVFYFDLRASRSARAQVVPSSQDRWSPDSAETAKFREERGRLERFLKGLRPLERADEGEPSFFLRQRIVADTTVRISSGDSVRRFVVDVSDPNAVPREEPILVTTYREPRVHLLRRYRIPDRQAYLVVLAFLGFPFEGGYEVQAPAFLGLQGIGVQRLDSPRGALP